MKEKKTEKDLSIIDEQSTDIEIDSFDNDKPEDSADTNKEKKKIKPWILILTAVLIAAIIFVGIFTWYKVTTLATYDGGRITRAEYNKAFKAEVMAQGLTDEILNDPENAEAVQEFKINLLFDVANSEILYNQLENLNIGNLTIDEIQTIEDDSRAMLDDYIDSNIDSIIMTLPDDYSEKEFNKARDEFEINLLNESGFLNFNTFVDLRVKNESFLKAYYEYVPDEDVAPTDEELRAEYDAQLEIQKSTYSENPAYYLYYSEQEEMPLFVPEGIRKVRHILIVIDDATQTEISTLRADGKDEEADALYAEGLEAIKPLAEEVLTKLNNKEITFTDAIAEYGDDPGMLSYPDGYDVCEGYEMYVEEFTAGSMSLAEVGEYTDLVATSYGYHIIEYYSDVPSETVAFEDVADQISTTLLESKRSNIWMEYLTQWPRDLELDFKSFEGLTDKEMNSKFIIYLTGIYN